MKQQILFIILLLLSALADSFSQSYNIDSVHIEQYQKRKRVHKVTWTGDAILISSGVGARILGSRLDNQRTHLSESLAKSLHHNDVHWFDRSATYKYNRNLMDFSDQLGMFTFAAPVALMLNRHMRKDAFQIALMFGETYLLASAMPMIAKGTIHRYRPYVYNPELTYEQKTEKDPGKAFFANQATLTFSSAAFVASVFEAYYPDSPWRSVVWIGSMSAATAIAYIRYETGLHYTSDLLVGALVGTAIGYTIPWLHRTERKKWGLRPTASSNEISMNFSMSF